MSEYSLEIIEKMKQTIYLEVPEKVADHIKGGFEWLQTENERSNEYRNKKYLGVFAKDDIGICEPVEGFKDERNFHMCVDNLLKLCRAKDKQIAELEGAFNKIKSKIESNNPFFEIFVEIKQIIEALAKKRLRTYH